MSKKKHPPSRKRLESADQDYLDKLNPKDREWIETFNQEYNQANFKHGKPIIHKLKAQQLEIYERNNARERCIMSRAKAGGKLDSVETMHIDNLTEEMAETIWQKKRRAVTKRKKDEG